MWCMVRWYDEKDGLKEKLLLQHTYSHGGRRWSFDCSMEVPPDWTPIHGHRPDSCNAHLAWRLRDDLADDGETPAKRAFTYLKKHPRCVFYGEDGSKWSLVKTPSEDDWGADKLTLRVESPDGTARMEPGYSFDVPNRAEPEEFPDIPERREAEDW